MVFSHHWIDSLGEKSYWWGGWWPVGLYCQPQSHSFSFGLSILNLGLGIGTWIWDLDLGLDLGLTIVFFQWKLDPEYPQTIAIVENRSNAKLLLVFFLSKIMLV